MFKLGVSSVIRWCRRWTETGSAEPKRSGGSVSPLEEHSDWILALIAKRPNLTLHGDPRRYGQAGHPRQSERRSALFPRHNVSLKRSLHAAEQKQVEVARARRRWMREQGMLDPTRLGVYRRDCHEHKHGAGSEAAACAASDWLHRCHTDIGKRSPLSPACAMTGSSPRIKSPV